jgi:hypothetical protein
MRKININKPSGLTLLSVGAAVLGIVASIAQGAVNNKKNEAYLDRKFDDWTKNINQN